MCLKKELFASKSAGRTELLWLVTPGVTIGQALQDAKSELAQTHPDLVDVMLGWSLMGDPAMTSNPDKAKILRVFRVGQEKGFLG